VIEVGPLGVSEEQEWDAFLLGQPGALFVHSIAYRDLLLGELGCEAEYLVARESGEIRGVLPIMWTADGGGRICNSLPYHGSHGGPVSSDPRVDRALIEAWNERARDDGTLASTMIENPFAGRPIPEPVHEMTDERISQFTLLPSMGGEEEVTELISREARSNVRRAARRGVSVELDNGAIAEVHRIHQENMRSLGAPPKSRRFFEALVRRLRPGEGFDIWTARVEGEVAAALLVVRFNGVSEYFTSATRIGFRSYDPHPALVFAALVHEARRGARIWNWGGTRHGMNGVFHFKRKWGSREGRYRYFVHLNDPSLRSAAPEELVARFPGFYVMPFSALEPSLA
jgi:Acetyltransferase (GNAT) domain